MHSAWHSSLHVIAPTELLTPGKTYSLYVRTMAMFRLTALVFTAHLRGAVTIGELLDENRHARIDP